MRIVLCAAIVGFHFLSGSPSALAQSTEVRPIKYGMCFVTATKRTRAFRFTDSRQVNERVIEGEWDAHLGRRSASYDDALCLIFDSLDPLNRYRTSTAIPIDPWLPSSVSLADVDSPAKLVGKTPPKDMKNAKPSETVARTTVSKREESIPPPKGPTPNQLKFQRELEAYNARLAEIEKIKADNAAKHAADKAQAEQEMARHRQQQAQADAAKRQYDRELAAHHQLVRERETKQDREQKVDWREAVVVCTLNPSDGQSQFGNWRCDGPLQMTYAKLDSSGTAPSAQAIVALSQACGGSREAVRDLGMVASSHLFGCSYGIHPKSTGGSPIDTAAKHGIGYVPGRATYRCPAYQSGCRTQ